MLVIIGIIEFSYFDLWRVSLSVSTNDLTIDGVYKDKQRQENSANLLFLCMLLHCLEVRASFEYTFSV